MGESGQENKKASSLRSERKFRYNYNPYSLKNMISRKNRQLSVAAVIIFLLFFSFITVNGITGYITYQKNTESEINAIKSIIDVNDAKIKALTSSKETCESNLQTKASELIACDDKLLQDNTYLIKCEEERNVLQNYSSELNALIAKCEEERSNLNVSYENLSVRFNVLVQKTAVDICCRPGIEISNWSISSNGIVCSGEFMANCSSGKTNY